HLINNYREPFWSHISLFELSAIFPGLETRTHEDKIQRDEASIHNTLNADKLPPWIYGMHDPGTWREIFEENKKTGWVLFHNILTGNFSQTRNQEFREWAEHGFGVMTRLVNAPFHYKGEGDGSIPLQEKYIDFSQQCAEFAQQSPDCLIWLIGNEMNISWHWPNKTRGLLNRRTAVPITPELFAECFNHVYRAIKGVQPNAWVIASGLNPRKHLGSISGDTILWFQKMLSLLESTDGIDIHTYIPGFGESVDQEAYTFEEFMEAIPAHLRTLPVFVTEATPNKVWSVESGGWMQQAYSRIDTWNQTADNQKIYALLPYRWKGIYPDKQDDPWNL
ncbi:MAG: hypothetical protein KC434_20465, partial [Anaerolineales bacterium]|nr:hypothetical protein [Anaerolineales bacterium]